MRKLFGKKYIWSFAVCHEVKYSFEYVADTKESDNEVNYGLYFGIDSIGVIRCVRIIGTRHITFTDYYSTNKCDTFELEVGKCWIPDLKRNCVNTTITFIDSVVNNYAECVLERDTSYLYRILSRPNMFEAPMFGELNKKFELKMSCEYYVSVKKDSDPGTAIIYGVNKFGVVKCVRTIGIAISRH